MKLTIQQRRESCTKRGAYLKEQVRALGLAFPVPKGWLDGEYTEGQIEAFLEVTKQLRAKVPERY